MAATSRTIATYDTKASHPFDPRKVRYSPRWMGAGAALGTMAVMAIQRGGTTAAAALGAAGLAGTLYATLLEPASPRLEYINITPANLPAELDGLRIGHLSDLHLGHPHARANTRWAVEQLVRERPDLIVMTGDFVSFAAAIAELPKLLAPLRAPLGIYAVPGNHDYWEGLDVIRESLAPLGIEFLVNSGQTLVWRGMPFYIAGVDDIWDGQPDFDATFAIRPANLFTLLLAHAPDLADIAAGYGVNVQFSGHTHGGHLRLPLLGSFCLPFYGVRYPAGFEQVGAMQLYVSRGLGGMPLRFGCPPEATIVTLTR